MILRKAEGLLTGVPSLEKRTGYIKTIIKGAVKIFARLFQKGALKSCGSAFGRSPQGAERLRLASERIVCSLLGQSPFLHSLTEVSFFVALGYSSETGNKHKTIIFGPVRNVPFLSIII